MNDRDLVLHGLAIKRHATAADVAELIDLAGPRVSAVLAGATAAQRAVEVNGGYALTPLARVALEGRYSLHFDAVRGDAEFVAAYESFEKLNRTLKDVITTWQTLEVGGASIANDHSDPARDAQVLARLGRVQDQIEPILTKLSRKIPRLHVYADKLLTALEAAEDGDPAWVSDVRRASYHTVWFELHEDLLRIMGKTREE
jgi:hypothetical protein